MPLGPFDPIPPREKIRRSHINDLRTALTGIQDAYDVAVANGFTGTRGQWLDSLVGPPGAGLAPIGSVADVASLPSAGNTVGDVYTVDADGHAYRWDGSAWVDIGQFRGDPGDPGDLTQAVADTLYADKGRVDPGTAGTARQRVVIDADGDPAWMDDQVFDLAHPYYGVTGSGVETERVQAAIDDAIAAGGGVIQFPNFTVKAGGLEVTAPGITFQGHGLASHLTSASGNTVTLTGANRFTCRDMRIQGVHGHVFEITDSLSHARFENLLIKQYADDKSILYGDDTISGRPELNYIDNLWLHCDVEHTETATVASFHLRGGAVNRNKWLDMRPTYSGNYVWLIETTAAESYANDNTIEAITAEVCTGGIFKGLGVQGTRLVDIANYDLLNSTTTHAMYLGPSTVSPILHSRYTTLENVRRNGFSHGAGFYDLYLSGSHHSTTLVNCGGSTPFTLRSGGARVLQIGGEVTWDNEGGAMILRARSTGSKMGLDPVSFGNTVQLRSYTTAGRPSAATAGAGAMAYDTTLGQPIWSDGTNWTDATGTVV